MDKTKKNAGPLWLRMEDAGDRACLICGQDVPGREIAFDSGGWWMCDTCASRREPPLWWPRVSWDYVPDEVTLEVAKRRHRALVLGIWGCVLLATLGALILLHR